MTEDCEICGQHYPNAMHYHHLIPRRYGGSNSDDNLILLCANCHGAIEQIYDRSFWEKANSIPDHKFSVDEENRGRPKKMASDLMDQVFDLRDKGVSYAAIARIIEDEPNGPESISGRTIQRYCKESD